MRELIKNAGQTEQEFCDTAKLETLEEMQAHRFKPAKAHLRKVASKIQEAAE